MHHWSWRFQSAEIARRVFAPLFVSERAFPAERNLWRASLRTCPNRGAHGRSYDSKFRRLVFEMEEGKGGIPTPTPPGFLGQGCWCDNVKQHRINTSTLGTRGCLYLHLIFSPWKFDSTPDKSALTVSTGTTGSSNDSSLCDATDCLKVKGNDCFTLSGHVFYGGDGSELIRAIAVHTSPKPIKTGAAKNMLPVLDFIPLLTYLILLMSSSALIDAGLAVKGLAPIVLMVAMTTDQASGNLKLLRHLMWKYRHVRQRSKLPFILVFANSLCLAHQLNLVSRSQYARIAGFIEVLDIAVGVFGHRGNTFSTNCISTRSTWFIFEASRSK